jgi:hypothetical protein
MPRSSPLRYSSQSDPEFAHAVETVRQDLLLIKACLAAMRVRLELKYSDTQPRWPAGDPRGGQWRPKEGGDGENAADEQGSLSDGSALFGEAPDGTPIEPAGALTDDPVRLQDEEGGMHGGHTINRHVGRTDDSLISDYLSRRSERQVGSRTIRIQEVPVGTFDSHENANDLVNRTIRERRADIEAALTRGNERLVLIHRFGFRTGREAWSDTVSSEPFIRPTYGILLVLQKDPVTRRDYRIVTAFPHNPFPHER